MPRRSLPGVIALLLITAAPAAAHANRPGRIRQFVRNNALPVVMVGTLVIGTGGLVADGMGALRGAHRSTVTVDRHTSVLLKGVRYHSLVGTDAEGRQVKIRVSKQEAAQAVDGQKYDVVVQTHVLFRDSLMSIQPAR